LSETLPVNARLSVILLRLNLTKLKIELKPGFICKTERYYNTHKNVFCNTRVRLFSNSAPVYFWNRPQKTILKE